MERREYLARIGASSSLGVVALAGCGAPGDGAAETPGVTETTAATDEQTETPANGTAGAGTQTQTVGATNEISMVTEGSNYVFDPIGLFVESGETITWINESGSHSSTAYTTENPASDVRRIPDDAEGWNSETLSEQGAEFSHTLEVEGTYDYYCIPHKTLGMVGRLVVGQPSGDVGDPPDGPVPSEQRIVEEGAVSQQAFDP